VVNTTVITVVLVSRACAITFVTLRLSSTAPAGQLTNFCLYCSTCNNPCTNGWCTN